MFAFCPGETGPACEGFGRLTKDVFGAQRIRANLILCWLGVLASMSMLRSLPVVLVLISTATIQAWAADGAVKSVDPVTGMITINYGGDIKARDVFQILRNGQSLGEGIIVTVSGGTATLLPRSGFKGPSRAGDAAHFVRHADMPAGAGEAYNPADTTGVWMTSFGGLEFILTLTQRGNEVSGSWHTSKGKVEKDCPVTGVVAGRTVKLKRTQIWGSHDQDFELQMSPDGTRMEGTGQGFFLPKSPITFRRRP